MSEHSHGTETPTASLITKARVWQREHSKSKMMVEFIESLIK